VSGYAHPLHTTWYDMLRRCYNPNHKFYSYYGGRGIKVCRRWRHSFDNFATDMGPRPEGMQIDRYPRKNGNYTPKNCRWATRSQQHRNKRSNHLLTFRGQTKTMWQWSEEFDVDPMLVLIRIKKGWSVEHALTIPKLGHVGQAGRLKWLANGQGAVKGKTFAERRIRSSKKVA
jgi:hypothetical protein